MTNRIFELIDQRGKELRSKGTEIFNQQLEAGKELFGTLQEQGSKLVETLQHRREDLLETWQLRGGEWTRDSRGFLSRTFPQGWSRYEKAENRVLSSVEELLERANSSLPERFEILNRAIGTLEDQVKTIKTRLYPEGEKAVVPGEQEGDNDGLPIDGYDELGARKINELLPSLAKSELSQLLEYEQVHKNRKTVLKAITHRLK